MTRANDDGSKARRETENMGATILLTARCGDRDQSRKDTVHRVDELVLAAAFQSSRNEVVNEQGRQTGRARGQRCVGGGQGSKNVSLLSGTVKVGRTRIEPVPTEPQNQCAEQLYNGKKTKGAGNGKCNR